jgi:hypothetical protein
MRRWKEQAVRLMSDVRIATNVLTFVRSRLSPVNHSGQGNRDQLVLTPENVIDTFPK